MRGEGAKGYTASTASLSLFSIKARSVENKIDLTKCPLKEIPSHFCLIKTGVFKVLSIRFLKIKRRNKGRDSEDLSQKENDVCLFISMDSDFKLQMNKNKRNVSLVLKCVDRKSTRLNSSHVRISY